MAVLIGRGFVVVMLSGVIMHMGDVVDVPQCTGPEGRECEEEEEGEEPIHACRFLQGRRWKVKHVWSA